MNLFKYFSIVLLIFFLSSCEKTDLDEQMDNTSVSFRETPVIDTAWLEAYKQDVIKAYNQTTLLNNYTLQEMIDGFENLLNVYFTERSEGAKHIIERSNFTIATNQNQNATLLAVAQNASTLLETHYSNAPAGSVTVMVDLKIDSLKNDTAYMTFHSSIASEIASPENPATPLQECGDVFDENEVFYLGFGNRDSNGNLPATGYNTSCDGLIPNTNFVEEAQDRLNQNYPIDYPIVPPPGYTFIGFAECDCIDLTEIITNGIPTINCAGFDQSEDQFQNSCYDSDVMNCLYCEIYNYVESLIPADYYFITLDLWSDMCSCGTSHSIIRMEYCYGKPIFVKDRSYEPVSILYTIAYILPPVKTRIIKP